MLVKMSNEIAKFSYFRLVLSKEQFSAQPLIVVNTATKSRLATQTQMPLDARLADQLAQQIFQQGTAVFAQQRRAN